MSLDWQKLGKTLAVIVGAIVLGAGLGAWRLYSAFDFIPGGEDFKDAGVYGASNIAQSAFAAAGGRNVFIWHHTAHEGFPTVVFFHGARDDLGQRAALFQSMADNGFGVVALSYQQFGGEAPRRSEEGFYEEARAAISYATSTLEVDPSRMIVFGEGFGASIAAQMSREFPIAALALQSPFTSLNAAFSHRYPGFPQFILPADSYDVLERVKTMRQPLLLIRGDRETDAPLEHGREVLAIAPGRKRELVIAANAGSQNRDQQIIEGLLGFARQHSILTADPIAPPPKAGTPTEQGSI